MFGNNKTIIGIEGMHCEHCAMRVAKTLESTQGVSKVKVDLKSKQATISSKVELDKDKIKNIIEELGYEVVEIK